MPGSTEVENWKWNTEHYLLKILNHHGVIFSFVRYRKLANLQKNGTKIIHKLFFFDFFFPIKDVFIIYFQVETNIQVNLSYYIYIYRNREFLRNHVFYRNYSKFWTVSFLSFGIYFQKGGKTPPQAMQSNYDSLFGKLSFTIYHHQASKIHHLLLVNSRNFQETLFFAN